MNRGARKQPIFVDLADTGTFKRLLAELTDRFGTRIHAYALMPNHVHLLLESDGNLPACMQFLFGQYSRLLNERYDWDGPVWKGRYRSRLVLDDRYWRHLLAYLHLNPVRGGLALLPEHSSMTSHCAYMGLELPPPWLTTSELLDSFGGRARLLDYVRAVQRKKELGPPEFEPRRLWEPPPPEPRPPEVADSEAAILRLERRLGPLSSLRQGRRGPNGDPRRWVAAWWLVRAGRLSNQEAADLLAANPTTVSRWIRRVLARVESSGELAELCQRLAAEED